MGSRPFIPAPNTASVEMIYLCGGITSENVIHIRKGTPFSLADLQAVRALMITWFTNTYRAQIWSGCSLVRVKTKALDTANSPMEDFQVSPTIAGTQGGNGFPGNVTFCVKAATASAGRSARGRWYVVGLSANGWSAPNDLTAGYASGIVNALNTLRTTLAGAGYTPCVTSFMANKAWRAQAVNFDLTQWVAIDNHIDSQRRRLAGRGQ